MSGEGSGQARPSTVLPRASASRPDARPGSSLGNLDRNQGNQEGRHRGSDMEGRQGAVGSPHYSTTDPKFYQPHPINS